MTEIIPVPVIIPDGRVGILTHRQGVLGAVQMGRQRILETYRLAELEFFYDSICVH